MLRSVALLVAVAAQAAFGQDVGQLMSRLSFSEVTACEDFAAGVGSPSHDGIVESKECGGCGSGKLCAMTWSLSASNPTSGKPGYKCISLPGPCKKFASGDQPTGGSSSGGSSSGGGGGGGGGSKPRTKPSSGGNACRASPRIPSQFRRKPSSTTGCSRRFPYYYSASKKSCSRLRARIYFCRRTTGPRLAKAGYFPTSTLCTRNAVRKCGMPKPKVCRPKSSSCRRRVKTGRAARPNARKICNSSGKRESMWYFSNRSKKCRRTSFYGCSTRGTPLTDAALKSAAYANRFTSIRACNSKCCG